ncbi:hypothetical protein HGO38_04495 [Rhizobium sp. CG5]|uniref:hypothetical protein n=1 Tax=Rhizobium sp. CG5 TaxID=2726076 RepID=UPI002034517C|nr:hypothetical protein [Rhizobium sp. CG5]MCM2472737.1 hypothetical protein [Rhizobium sp. CG5]
MKEIRQALLNGIGNRVGEFGFDRKAIGQSFKREFPGGISRFHLAFINHKSDFDVTADVAVRFHKLEELANENDNFISKKDKSLTNSLGAELGNIAGVGQMRWHVATIDDLDSVTTGILDAFIEIGLPYLEVASTMEGAYRLLSAPGKNSWLHNPVLSARAKRVVGLAKLLESKFEGITTGSFYSTRFGSSP